MKKIFLILSIIFYALFINTNIATNIAAETIILGNNKYIIFSVNNKTLSILDLEQQNVIRKQFDFTLENIELCPNYPFISLCGCEEKTNFMKKNYYIYDIEQDRLYNTDLYLDIDEQRWGNIGEYTYFNKRTSFLLIETRNLRKYLESPSTSVSIIEITGHPVGYIWQVCWIGSYLLYATGISERECWGVLDIKNKTNFFISCCGMSKNINFAVPCNKITKSLDTIMEHLISLIEKKKCLKVSFDFYKDIQNIIDNEKEKIKRNEEN